MVAAAAAAMAHRVWRRWGARSESEARGTIIAGMRRRLGTFVSREFARHRLRRLPLVGVPRAALDARRRQLGAAASARFYQGRAESAQDFFAQQAQGARALGS